MHLEGTLGTGCTVLVGVELESQLLVGLLDLALARASSYPQHLRKTCKRINVEVDIECECTS
jgi:hypothetical protein